MKKVVVLQFINYLYDNPVVHSVILWFQPLLHVPFDLQLQETLLMDTYLRFLVQMYFHQSWSNDEIGKIENRFTTGVAKVLECFVTIQPITPNHLHDLTDIMTVCIQNLHHKVPQEKVTYISIIVSLYPIQFMMKYCL